MSFFKRYLILVLLFLSILLAFFLYFSQNRLAEERSVFENFKKESSALILLKEKWKSHKNYKKIFTRLRAISKPTKDRTKGAVHIFKFGNLSQINLNRILLVLFNSGFIIKELDIEREKAKISLYVEVKL